MTELSVATGSNTENREAHRFCGYAPYFTVNITVDPSVNELTSEDNIVSRPLRFNCKGITGAFKYSKTWNIQHL